MRKVGCGSRMPRHHNGRTSKLVVLRSKAGFSSDLEVSKMREASLGKAKQPPSASATSEAFGCRPVCRCWVFPCARPRMCRLEVWVAALNHIEAHSHTLSSF